MLDSGADQKMSELDFNMTKIYLNDLPEYLKNSFLYNALIKKEDDSDKNNTDLLEDENNIVLVPNEAIYDLSSEKTGLCDSLEEFEKTTFVKSPSP